MEIIEKINERIRVAKLVLDIQFSFFFIHNRPAEEYEVELLFGAEGAD